MSSVFATSSRSVAVWAARGGHGATTVAVTLSHFWGTSVDGAEPWTSEWLLGVGANELNATRLPVIDAGIAAGFQPATTNVVVLRGPCLMGIRTLVPIVSMIDVLFVIREPWRVISNNEVAEVLGLPVSVEIPFSERVARMSDAGLLGARLESLKEFDGLRRWARAFAAESVA